MADAKKKYVVATGMDSGTKRMERGEPFTGNAKSLPWLIEQGHVVEEGSDEHAAIIAELEPATATEEEA